MSGTLPALSFRMTRASDGKVVSAADYRGKIVLLYFGYTFCPDVCCQQARNT
jgi:protein SCO1